MSDYQKSKKQLIAELAMLRAGAAGTANRTDEPAHVGSELSTALDTFSIGHFICDAQWRIMRINPTTERLLGIHNRDAQGQYFWDMFPATVGTALETEYRLAAAGAINEFVGLHHLSGKVLHSICFQRHGNGISVYFHDTTKYHPMSNMHPGDEKQYQSLFDQAPIGIFRATISGRYLSANLVQARMHGYATPDEFISNIPNIRDTLWDDAHVHDEFIHNLLAKGEITNFECLRKKRDGSTFWISINARLTKDPLIDEDIVEGFITDITERKLADETLREKTAILEAQINTTLDGILIVNETKKVLLVNNRFRELFDTPSSIFKNDDDIPLLQHVTNQVKDKSAFLNKVNDLYNSPNEISRDEIEFNNGMIVDRYSAPVLGYDARYYGRLWIFRDISERKRLQEMMVQTEKMMSLGGLAAGMAHEINNPLGGVLQNVQVLLRRLTQDNPVNIQEAERVHCSFESIKAFMANRGILSGLDSIREAGTRAAQIVSSMLEFSRRGDSSHVPVDLNALLDKAIALCETDYDLKKRYDFRHIQIERDYEADLPPVHCSANQIEQVVMNLLRNAAQAMVMRPPDAPPGTIVLRTRLEADRVRLELKDNGPGMNDQTRRNAFDPFFTTKPVGEGTGLGLSISYFIITNNHRGTIVVESLPGVGTTFIIHLPLRSHATGNG